MTGLIKICGVATVDDALMAVEAGAGAIGLVFAASPRRVSPAQARAIAAALPAGTLKVGVFVEHSESEIDALAGACGLDAVQLSGPRQPEAAAALRGVWRGLRMASLEAARAEAARWSAADVFLLEPDCEGRYGGTGRTFEWELARALAATFPARRLVLAGGLTPDNVAAAIAISGAGGVDVSSGVESSPGHKDSGRVRAFIAAAQEAFETRSAATT